MVIIEIESMSRSSVKDLSSSTVSAAIPVSSLTSSARPARTSSVDSAMVFLLEYRLTVQQSMGVAARGTRAVERDLGEDDDLGGENEARAEADLQGKTSAELRVFLEKAVCSERDRRGRGVACRLNVAPDGDGVGELQLLGELIDDAHV